MFQHTLPGIGLPPSSPSERLYGSAYWGNHATKWCNTRREPTGTTERPVLPIFLTGTCRNQQCPGAFPPFACCYGTHAATATAAATAPTATATSATAATTAAATATANDAILCGNHATTASGYPISADATIGSDIHATPATPPAVSTTSQPISVDAANAAATNGSNAAAAAAASTVHTHANDAAGKSSAANDPG